MLERLLKTLRNEFEQNGRRVEVAYQVTHCLVYWHTRTTLLVFASCLWRRVSLRLLWVRFYLSRNDTMQITSTKADICLCTVPHSCTHTCPWGVRSLLFNASCIHQLVLTCPTLRLVSVRFAILLRMTLTLLSVNHCGN